MAINPIKKAQIKAQNRDQVRILLFDEVLMAVLAEYSDYNNIFLAENVAKLSEYIKINDYAIKLEENKQLSFGCIYNLKPVELEILKIYIKINLPNSFI